MSSGTTSTPPPPASEPASGSGSTPVRVRLRGRRPVHWQLWAQQYGALAALAVLFLYNASQTPFFLTSQSLLFVQLRQAAPIAIVAIGMAMVIGTAGIDLSVGSVMAISGQVGALSLLAGRGPLLSILFALLAAAACGVFNGTLVARYGVQPIIATLILFIAGRGIAQLLTGGELQAISNDTFQWLGLGKPFGVPVQVFLALIVALIAWFVMRTTAYGRYVVSVGGNETAARLAGVPVGRVKLIAYVVSATLAGLVGLIAVSVSSASDANNTGLGMELDAIAAVAVAGTSLYGGRVTIPGTVVGALMLKLLQNTLIAHGIPRETAQIVEGGVIVLALWIQRHGG